MTYRDVDVAVLHGNYFARGGGEVVADAIAETFDAPLYYGFGHEGAMPDDGQDRIKLFDCRDLTDRLASSVYQFRDACFAWWGQHLPEIHDYDVVIHSGNEFGWYVPPDDQLVVKYVHSPPRSAYDLFPQEGDSRLLRLYAMATRTLYRPTTTFPDRYIANSELVQRRITKYWGKPSTVVYPPVDLEGYGADRAETDETLYLTFNRLYRHKRTREIVEAFADIPDRRLVVGGEGPERETLEEIATDNVEIRGYLSEDEKRDLLARARALVYNPVNEDFGIIPIEAFASGTPVVAVADGFTRYQVTDNLNGVSYADGDSSDAVYWALRRFERDGISASEEQLERYAEHFSRERFEVKLQRVIDETAEDLAITPVPERHDWERLRGEGDAERERTVADGGER